MLVNLINSSAIRELERIHEFYSNPRMFEAVRASMQITFEKLEAVRPDLEKTFQAYPSVFDSPGMKEAIELAGRKARELEKLFEGYDFGYNYDFELETKKQLEKVETLKTVVSFKGDDLFIYGKKIQRRKLDSIHALFLCAIVELCRDDNICTYQIIENFFRERGLAPLEGDRMRKRVKDAYRAGIRFLQLPERLEDGGELIQLIPGQGFKFKNDIKP